MREGVREGVREMGVRARVFARAHLHNDRAAQPRHLPGQQRALSPAQTEPEPQPARATGAARPHAALRREEVRVGGLGAGAGLRLGLGLGVTTGRVGVNRVGLG